MEDVGRHGYMYTNMADELDFHVNLDHDVVEGKKWGCFQHSTRTVSCRQGITS